MLSKRTRKIAQSKAPAKGPCGGDGIWYLEPARHWCKMTDAEVALFLLGGGELHEKWGAANFDKAWLDGTIALKKDDGYKSVVLNSKCRWAKK